MLALCMVITQNLDIITLRLDSSCLAGLCLVLYVVLCVKVRKINTTLLVLKEVQQASSFIYRKSVSVTPPNETADLLSEFTWVHASVIISVIVLVILLIVMYLSINQSLQKGQLWH